MTKKQEILYAYLIVIAFIQVILFDSAYNYNLFNVNNQIYMRRHAQVYTVGEVLINSDNYILFSIILLVLNKCIRQVMWFKYLVSFIIDCLVIGLFFVLFSNPYFQNWNQTLALIIAISVFIFKLLYFKLIKSQK